jgi:hypothetical protein
MKILLIISLVNQAVKDSTDLFSFFSIFYKLYQEHFGIVDFVEDESIDDDEDFSSVESSKVMEDDRKSSD